MRTTNTKLKLITLAATAFMGFNSLNAQNYSINTLAGNGTGGYSGDGGQATAAEVNSPIGVSIDASGNIYIADYNNNRIRKVNASTGLITTIAGNGTGGYSGDGGAATNAELYNPIGVTIDASGNIYIADLNNNRIRKVNTAGIITTIAGNGIAGFTGDGAAATAAELGTPLDVAVDASGNVYIAAYSNDRIRKVSTTGIITTIAGNGTIGYNGDGGAATATELYYPTGVAVDASGNIYIADYRNSRIRKVSTTGIITTIAGNGTAGFTGDGAAATAAELEDPESVAVDASGNIYIADRSNSRIRKINNLGIITTIAGNGTIGYNGDGGAATAAELYYPAGVAVDNSGNVYIADQDNNRVRELTAAPITYFTANKTSICVGDSVAFTDTSRYSPTAWKWTFTGGTPNTSTLQNPTITYNTAGVFAVKLKTTNSIGSDSLTKTNYITVNALPFVTITGNDSASIGHPDVLTATGGGTYLWTTGSTNDTTIVSPTTATVYKVKVTDSLGCSAVDSFKVSIKIITTGIATLSQNNGTSLYPNPANTTLNLSFTMHGLSTNALINVLDVTGKSMMQLSTEISNGKTLPINISSLAAGIYFVRITTEKNTQTIKFVKTNK